MFNRILGYATDFGCVVGALSLPYFGVIYRNPDPKVSFDSFVIQILILASLPFAALLGLRILCKEVWIQVIRMGAVAGALYYGIHTYQYIFNGLKEQISTDGMKMLGVPFVIYSQALIAAVAAIAVCGTFFLKKSMVERRKRPNNRLERQRHE